MKLYIITYVMTPNKYLIIYFSTRDGRGKCREIFLRGWREKGERYFPTESGWEFLVIPLLGIEKSFSYSDKGRD